TRPARPWALPAPHRQQSGLDRVCLESIRTNRLFSLALFVRSATAGQELRPMIIRRRLTLGLTVTAAVLWPLAGTVTPAAAATYTPLPAHVYAPYYETYLAPNTAAIATTATQSGARYMTLAFLSPPARAPAPWTGTATRPSRCPTTPQT